MAIVASPAAAAAYSAAQQQSPVGVAPQAKAATGGGGFAEALEQAAQSAVDTMRHSEQTTLKAASGDAELLDIVAAVNDAESTLRTVVAVRDKVVQSYQEILRMPI